MPRVKSAPGGPQWTVANVPTAVHDWEAARVFLEVSRCGSFRAAAQKLGHSVNALRRTVDKFERALGVQLLTRYVAASSSRRKAAELPRPPGGWRRPPSICCWRATPPG